MIKNNTKVISDYAEAYRQLEEEEAAKKAIHSPLLETTIEGAKGVILGDVDISSYKTLANHELKDIYQQSYWTTAF